MEYIMRIVLWRMWDGFYSSESYILGVSKGLKFRVLIAETKHYRLEL